MDSVKSARRFEQETAIIRQAIVARCIADTLVLLEGMTDREVQDFYEELFPCAIL